MAYVETVRYGGNNINAKDAIEAGLLGGLIFLTLEMLMVPLFAGGSPWGPPRMIAAIVLGRDVLPPPATFNLGIVVVALIVHFILSIAYAFVIGLIVHRLRTATAAFVGLIFGFVLYFVNFYGFTAFFPWFAEARNWISVFAHFVFGLSTAVIYKALLHRERKIQV